MKKTWKEIIKEIRVRKVSKEALVLARKYNYRAYMIERYVRILGLEEAKKLIEAFEKPLPQAIRCNHLKIDCSELENRLTELGFVLEKVPWSIHGYRVMKEPYSPTIGSTHEYLKGYYYVYRDIAPMIPPLLLVEKGEKDVIFDGCAAPGGKATHLAQLMEGEGLVIANDIALYRLMALISHVIRLGLKNIIVTWHDLRLLAKKIKRKFNKILLDVPCSAEGTIMLDKTRKYKTTQLDLAKIVAREIELLNSGIEMLSDNGILMYVTCSIAPEENEYVVSQVINSRNDAVVIAPQKKLFEWDKGLRYFGNHEFHWSVENCIRIWPHKHNMIGMTICIIEKTSK